MKIAICEDEEIIAKKIWNMFLDKPTMDARYFLNPVKLIESYEMGERYDILFCDASMEPLDGISLCEKIRKFDKKLYIVFITNYIDYAPAGYEIGLFRYLLKPVSKKMIDEVLLDIKTDMEHTSKLVFKTAEGSVILEWQNILYIEIDDKESCIYYNEDHIRVIKSLSELEEQLKPCPFFRIHRKYLVNLDRIREFDQYRVTLDNGKTLPISKRKSIAFKKALYYFLEETTL